MYYCIGYLPSLSISAQTSVAPPIVKSKKIINNLLEMLFNKYRYQVGAYHCYDKYRLLCVGMDFFRLPVASLYLFTKEQNIVGLLLEAANDKRYSSYNKE